MSTPIPTTNGTSDATTNATTNGTSNATTNGTSNVTTNGTLPAGQGARGLPAHQGANNNNFLNDLT